MLMTYIPWIAILGLLKVHCIFTLQATSFAPLAFIIKKNVGASVNGTTSIL